MIDQYLPGLPYALIGQVVVALFLLVLAVIVVGVLVFSLLFTWIRGLTWVSNRMYKGYDIQSSDERPPIWKVRIAGITIALARFKFRKLPAVYREAPDLTDDKTTFRQYLSNTIRS